MLSYCGLAISNPEILSNSKAVLPCFCMLNAKLTFGTINVFFLYNIKICFHDSGCYLIHFIGFGKSLSHQFYFYLLVVDI